MQSTGALGDKLIASTYTPIGHNPKTHSPPLHLTYEALYCLCGVLCGVYFRYPPF
jgi:hypothetical protein